ncbi:unnamed protein product [Staurois parvus]|uniref:Uncharacterized protein n=1 Tax=Staurois parvus TaxID=386267 RepID=A0ABN9DMW9_9NEOB|nr:unnamed protein product [Staurois parvus]
MTAGTGSPGVWLDQVIWLDSGHRVTMPSRQQGSGHQVTRHDSGL